MKVVPGRAYAGGGDRPFFVSLGAIRDHLEGLGFVRVVVRERSAAPPPVHVHPDVAPWNVWATGEWAGPPKALDLPAGVSWTADLGPVGAPAPGPPPLEPPAPAAPPRARLGAGTVVAVVAVAAFVAGVANWRYRLL